MLLKIIKAALILTSIVPVYGINITVQLSENKENHEIYYVERNFSKLIKSGHSEHLIGMRKNYSLNITNNTIQLDVTLGDIIRIYASAHCHPYVGHYSLRSLGKKLRIDESINETTLLIDKDQYSLIKN